jgi:hypothetical protein
VEIVSFAAAIEGVLSAGTGLVAMGRLLLGQPLEDVGIKE